MAELMQLFGFDIHNVFMKQLLSDDGFDERLISLRFMHDAQTVL